MGTTALLILALIIFIALQISSGGIGKRTIHAEFAQAAGISSGDAVNVAGVQVGTVTKTALAGKLVRVDMQVDDTVDLGPSSRAAIKLTTLLGSGTSICARPAREHCPTRRSGSRTPRFRTRCKRSCRMPPSPSNRSMPTTSPSR